MDSAWREEKSKRRKLVSAHIWKRVDVNCVRFPGSYGYRRRGGGFLMLTYETKDVLWLIFA